MGYFFLVGAVAGFVWWLTEDPGIAALAMSLILGFLGALVLAWIRPWPFPRRVEKLTSHRVAVYDVPQPPAPYFVAMCECDWVGKIRQTSEQAFDDARKHSPTVDTEIKHPLEET